MVIDLGGTGAVKASTGTLEASLAATLEVLPPVL